MSDHEKNSNCLGFVWKSPETYDSMSANEGTGINRATERVQRAETSCGRATEHRNCVGGHNGWVMPPWGHPSTRWSPKRDAKELLRSVCGT